MKKFGIAGIIAAATIVALALASLSCNTGPSRAGHQIVTIEYERPSVPCPTCPDEPFPFAVIYQRSLSTGSFQRVGENSYIASLEVPENVAFLLNVSDRKMYDGVNECSWTMVGENIRVNGQPVHISFHDCAVPWAGEIRLTVNPDRSVTQAD